MAKKATVKDDDRTTLQAEWCDEIDRYEQEASKWTKRAKDTIKRYKDDRDRSDGRVRFNILWSNVQVLKPALYSQDPIPRVERRFRDKNPVARVAADILDRALAYEIECQPYGNTMRASVHDRLLPGRGTAWVRYVPHFRDVAGDEGTASTGAQVTDDAQTAKEVKEPDQELLYEEAVPDYVHWEDFGHTFARTWEELRAVWRRVYMSRRELIDRFGEKEGKKITLDYSPWADKDDRASDKKTKQMKKAVIYEIWDKEEKKVYWVHKDHDDVLDERDDPLGLEDFFPCPMPLFANLANDTLIPQPDYMQYQDQALELDELTGRIANISKSIKVAGAYDAKVEALGRILQEGIENKMVPVAQWSMFSERGGLKGAMDLLPTREMAQTLKDLYEAREATKQDLYEVTGISDIIRGFSSGVSKTATEQNIKSQFANLRLSEGQREVARFARDTLRIMGQVIAFHFSQTTISMMTGVKLMTQEEKARAQAMQQQQAAQFQQAQAQHQAMSAQAQQTGQQPPPPPQQPPPLPPEVAEAMKQPTWEEVMALFRDKANFGFNIEIETDSTISTDERADKEATTELLASIGAFAQGTAVAIQEGLITVPVAQAILVSSIRKHRFSKEVEEAIEQSQGQPQQPKPNEQMQKVQQQMQAAQQKLQSQAAQNEKDALRNQHDKAMLGVQQEKGQVKLDAAADKIQLLIDKSNMLSKGQAVEAVEGEEPAPNPTDVALQGIQQMQQTLAQIGAQVIQALHAPKQALRPDGTVIATLAPQQNVVQ